MKKIVIGADHAGFELKLELIKHLQQDAWLVDDKGTYGTESVDYPDFAHPVALAVESEHILGILICGSANGVCITANKHGGVRAALAWTPEIAALAKQHNDANIVCIPARFVDSDTAKQIVDAFLSNSFEGGRHENRVNKISC